MTTDPAEAANVLVRYYDPATGGYGPFPREAFWTVIDHARNAVPSVVPGDTATEDVAQAIASELESMGIGQSMGARSHAVRRMASAAVRAVTAGLLAPAGTEGEAQTETSTGRSVELWWHPYAGVMESGTGVNAGSYFTLGAGEGPITRLDELPAGSVRLLTASPQGEAQGQGEDYACDPCSEAGDAWTCARTLAQDEAAWCDGPEQFRMSRMPWQDQR